MANQNRPASNKEAPDPARTYERAKPEAESGMGRLGSKPAPPSNAPDRADQAVKNRPKHTPVSDEDADRARMADPDRMSPPAYEGSMLDEEPLGEDQAPQGKMRPQDKRHPRKEGKGGTP